MFKGIFLKYSICRQDLRLKISNKVSGDDDDDDAGPRTTFWVAMA